MTKLAPPPTSTKAKKPYAKPAVVFREPLEAVAAVCTGTTAKAAPVGSCTQGPISS